VASKASEDAVTTGSKVRRITVAIRDDTSSVVDVRVQELGSVT